MPYKSKKDQQDAWKRWAKKHPAKRNAQSRLQKKGAYHNPGRKTCSRANCDKPGERHHPNNNQPERVVWLCKAHHEPKHPVKTKKK